MSTRFSGSDAVRRVAAVSENRSTLDEFLERLRQIGADDDELAAVRDGWSTADPAERDYARRVSDGELRAELARVRDEFDLHRDVKRAEPTPEDTTSVAVGLDPIEGGSSLAGASDDDSLSLPAEATTVPLVLEWVGDDRQRAQVAYDAEMDRDEPRVTLLDGIDRLLDADPD